MFHRVKHLFHLLVSLFFTSLKINIALSLAIQQKINDEFTDLISIPVPFNLHQYALPEIDILELTQYYFKKNNLNLQATNCLRSLVNKIPESTTYHDEPDTVFYFLQDNLVINMLE
ncbi:unnamed protein product [Rotaria socialis]|uniref:Uncharacterized protein n=1 Tax=Rotaria socialis TaxID=392032 RepID=A0A817U9Z7_9BILA|nr:unnamed protein product [Rotaria socialis]CAF3328526.1 unnamed protein product [Rotaria socialis]CAF3380352.1 unnamed protein product [Rotaria socialis]CAF3570949.1 unnamed protein product [Rotaria socialis]CAF4498140.1 unnamed protein product [Rotaria socialis]